MIMIEATTYLVCQFTRNVDGWPPRPQWPQTASSTYNFSSGRHEEHFSFQPQLQKVRLFKVSICNYLALYAASMASGGLGTKILFG